MPIVAIELQEPGTSNVRVFTPTNVRLEVWQVRLIISMSKDSPLNSAFLCIMITEAFTRGAMV